MTTILMNLCNFMYDSQYMYDIVHWSYFLTAEHEKPLLIISLNSLQKNDWTVPCWTKKSVSGNEGIMFAQGV
jgi:phage antirepressor YoqD-like protein